MPATWLAITDGEEPFTGLNSEMNTWAWISDTAVLYKARIFHFLMEGGLWVGHKELHISYLIYKFGEIWNLLGTELGINYGECWETWHN